MRKRFKNQRMNQDGSVLLAVLAIMTFATVLTATAFSFTHTASTRSVDNVNEKQAYYTASTCLETFVESVLTPNNPNWEDFIVVAENGGVSEPIDLDGMGTCTISVEKPAGLEYIKVTSTAVVNNREENVVCYLKAITEPGEAVFENAVELTGSMDADYNNINVLGDMASSNDENAETRVYTFANEPDVFGQYFQYGSFYVSNHFSLKESIRGSGSSITASKYIFFGANGSSITSKVQKKNNNDSNYVYAGNTFATGTLDLILGEDSAIAPETGVRAGDIDLFAPGIILGATSELESGTAYSRAMANKFEDLKNVSGGTFGYDYRGGNRYKQWGNVYCFANGGSNSGADADGTDGELAGNLIVDGNITAQIYGDVFVEGNLYVSPNASLTIYGNLYVKGHIVAPNVSKLSVVADGARSDTTGIINCTSYYALYPISTVKELDDAAFDAFKTGRGKTPSSEYEGTKFVYHAEDLLISDDSDVSTISTSYKHMVQNPSLYAITDYNNVNYNGDNFDVLIDTSCYITASDANKLMNKKVLIKVTNSDILVVFENGTWITNGCRFVVANETKHLEASDTLAPSFCYFTVDTYQPGATVTPVYKKDEAGNKVLDRNGKPIVVDSEHSGFVTNATLNFTTNSSIVDYDTWKNANIGVDGCGSKALNLTGTEILGTYQPVNDKGYIIMLLTEGTTVTASNQMLFEGTIYGRQATFDINNGFNINYEVGTPSASVQMSKQTVILGSCVVGKLKTSNDMWISYLPPSNKSNLANVGGSGADKVLGYEVVKYTQDLS